MHDGRPDHRFYGYIHANNMGIYSDGCWKLTPNDYGSYDWTWLDFYD